MVHLIGGISALVLYPSANSIAMNYTYKTDAHAVPYLVLLWILRIIISIQAGMENQIFHMNAKHWTDLQYNLILDLQLIIILGGLLVNKKNNLNTLCKNSAQWVLHLQLTPLLKAVLTQFSRWTESVIISMILLFKP